MLINLSTQYIDFLLKKRSFSANEKQKFKCLNVPIVLLNYKNMKKSFLYR